jgi:dipeptidyl aminopeptidase/acylaminoacyl peptidase
MIVNHSPTRRGALSRRTGTLLFPALLILFAGVLVIPSFGQHPATNAQTHRYFTVRDSIEMSRFDTIEGGPLVSPDHQYFSIVTSRGLIDTDSIESTLWVFRTAEVRHFLGSKQDRGTLHGKAVFKLAQVPLNSYTIPYAPVISSVRWSQDSKALLFLGQDGRGERRLYHVDARSGAGRVLTLRGEDVSLYEVQGRTIVYLVVPAKQSIPIGRAINADALEVTGEPLAKFMLQTDESLFYREIWVLRNGRRWRLRRDGRHPIHLANHFPDVLAISPDEKAVAVLVPSETLSADWDSYEPTAPYLRLRHNDPNSTDQFNFARAMQYMVFDLQTGKSRFTMNAPHAYALGYVQQDSAIWSAVGKELLLTNTFLPLGEANPNRTQRLFPCAGAIVDIGLNKTTCIAWSRYTQENRASLLSAMFSKNGSAVVLSFNTPNGTDKEVYERQGATWYRKQTIEENTVGEKGVIGELLNGQFPVQLEIRESPNNPPALYATDLATGQSRKLWDPNPQMSSLDLGEVAPFEWTDRTGYKWTGQLVKPPNYHPGQRYPLVIQTYGFSPGFVSDGLLPTASAVRSLAASDIMVLQAPRRRDHDGTAQEAPDQLIGFQSAIKRLNDDGLIDPKKVGIIGFSHTCYHVESALVNDPDRFAAATIADGMDGSYLQYLYSVADPVAKLAEDIYGTRPFGSGLGVWVERAPGFNLNKLQTPLRVETIGFASVLAEWETYAALMAQGKPIDFVYFPVGDHLLQKPLERLASQQGNVDWFRFWLKGEEDPDPSKRNQYVFWERLRDERAIADGAKQNRSD